MAICVSPFPHPFLLFSYGLLILLRVWEEGWASGFPRFAAAESISTGNFIADFIIFTENTSLDQTDNEVEFTKGEAEDSTGWWNHLEESVVNDYYRAWF